MNYQESRTLRNSSIIQYKFNQPDYLRRKHFSKAVFKNPDSRTICVSIIIAEVQKCRLFSSLPKIVKTFWVMKLSIRPFSIQDQLKPCALRALRTQS